MQSCIRHFFVVFHEFDLGSSIRQSRILAEGLPLAGNGKFPYLILARAIIAILHSAFLVFFLVNPSSVRQYGLPYSCRGTPACGKRQIPVERKTCSHFFEILFNAKTTFYSCLAQEMDKFTIDNMRRIIEAKPQRLDDR